MRTALDVVAPFRCAGCNSPGLPLCLSCEMALEHLPQPEARSGVRAAFPYGSPIDRIIQQAKYGDAREALDLASDRAAHRLTIGPQVTLVPIPLGRRRRRQRGFNQAEVVARALSTRWQAPLDLSLVRRLETPPQVGQRRESRQANLVGAFVWRGGSLTTSTVVLVDDVLTTGATLDAAAAALRLHGARGVTAAVLCRVLISRGQPYNRLPMLDPSPEATFAWR